MTVAETAARTADDLRAVLAVPHSDEYRRHAVTAARVSVAKAIRQARIDPSLSRYAQRRYLASGAAYDDLTAILADLPATYPELLAVLDAMTLAEAA